MVSLVPSLSMPVIPGNKESSSGISSLPNSYSTIASPTSDGSPIFSPRTPFDQQTSLPIPLTSSGHVDMNCYPMVNGHTVKSNNGSSNKNHIKRNLPNDRVNGRLNSYSETTLWYFNISLLILHAGLNCNFYLCLYVCYFFPIFQKLFTTHTCWVMDCIYQGNSGFLDSTLTRVMQLNAFTIYFHLCLN